MNDTDWKYYSNYFIKVNGQYYEINVHYPDYSIPSHIYTINGVPFPKAIMLKAGVSINQAIPDENVRNSLITMQIYEDEVQIDPEFGPMPSEPIGVAYFLPYFDMQENALTGMHLKIDTDAAYYNDLNKELTLKYTLTGTSSDLYYKVLNLAEFNQLESGNADRDDFINSSASLTKATVTANGDEVTFLIDISSNEVNAKAYGIFIVADPKSISSRICFKHWALYF